MVTVDQMDQIYQEYRKAISYLDMAFDFQNHPQRPWIDDATLGRWFLEGAREVVSNFERASTANSSTLDRDEVLEIAVWNYNLTEIKKNFSRGLSNIFPNNKLIHETPVK